MIILSCAVKKQKIKKQTKVCFKFALAAVVSAAVVLSCGGKAKDETAAIAERQTQSETSFTDSRDGKTYRIVTIGSQIWMAENLHFETESGSWCYGDDAANCEIYGLLYDWETAMNVCPQGWRLPSDEDWQALINSVGGDSIAGTKLKSSSGWFGNGNGTDEFGFSALPGGYRWGGGFADVGSFGSWWTTAEYDATSAWGRGIGYGHEGVGSSWRYKTNGFSVRCVRDD